MNRAVYKSAEINWATNIDWSVETIWTTLIFVIVGYLIGSILLSRMYISIFRGGNVVFEKNGQKKTMTRFGTSMTSYFLGSKFAIAQFFWDFIKPILFFWIFMWPLYYCLPDTFGHAILAAGLLAVFIGHLWPVYWKFKGGVGVATGVGILFLINWLAGIIGFTTWFIFAVITRDSGIGGFFGATVGVAILFFPIMIDNNLIFYAFRSDAQYLYMFLIIWVLMAIKFHNWKFFKNYYHKFKGKLKKA